MKFQAVDELAHFSFEDCVIRSVETRDTRLVLTLEALIVLPENSQNTNYTKSYAGETELSFLDYRLSSVSREGYRRYSADGILQEETPDVPLTGEEIPVLLKRLPGTWLLSVKETSQNPEQAVNDSAGGQEKKSVSGRIAVLRVEFPPEEEFDTLPTESYELILSYTTCTAAWERYMNRVETPGQ